MSISLNMKRVILHFGFCFVLKVVITVVNPVFAQYSYGQLVGTLENGARDLSLANATASDISIISETFANPASLSFKSKKSIYFNSYHSWTTNIYSAGLGVKNLRIKKSSFGFDIQYLSSGFNEINYLGGVDIFQPDLNRIQLSVSYSYLIAPVLSIGAIGHAYTAWNDFDAREHVNLSVGSIYSPSNNLSYSIQFKNLGYGLGYNTYGNGNTVLLDKNIEESVEYGVSLYFPERGSRKKVALYASTQTKLKVSEIYYRFAGEFIVKKSLFVRLGYLNGAEDYLIGASESGMTFGLGLNLTGLEVNYSIAPGSNFFNRVHQFGFSIKL